MVCHGHKVNVDKSSLKVFLLGLFNLRQLQRPLAVVKNAIKLSINASVQNQFQERLQHQHGRRGGKLKNKDNQGCQERLGEGPAIVLPFAAPFLQYVF